MKTTEKLQLLSDILEDEDYRLARQQAVSIALAEAQRRRRQTSTRRTLALAASLTLTAAGYWLILRQTASVESKAFTIVRTQPLHAEEIVKTGHVRGTANPSGDLLIVSTTDAQIEIVKTGHTTEELSDQQLLDFFKGRPVALVNVSPHERQLILLDDAASKGK